MKKLNREKIYFLPKANEKYVDVIFFYNPKKEGCGKDSTGNSNWTYSNGKFEDKSSMSDSVIDKDDNYLYDTPDKLIEFDLSVDEFINRINLIGKLTK